MVKNNMYVVCQGSGVLLRLVSLLLLFDILTCHVILLDSENDREENKDTLMKLTERELKQLLQRKLKEENEIVVQSPNVIRDTEETREHLRSNGLVNEDKLMREVEENKEMDLKEMQREDNHRSRGLDNEEDEIEREETFNDQAASTTVNREDGRELQESRSSSVNLEEDEDNRFLHLAVLKTDKRQLVAVEEEGDTDLPNGGSIVNTDDGPLKSPAALALELGPMIDLHYTSPVTVFPPSKRRKRNFGYRTNILWENGTFPFRVELNTFSDQSRARTVIDEAVAIIERETCIQMTEITQAQNSTYVDHIVVLGNETGCWSWLGNAQFGTKQGKPQLLSLGSGCVSVGTALHEFLHALAMLHEQSRHDRDDSIRVLFDNINSDMQYNFDKEATLDRNPYDLSSVLQYGPYGFAVSGKTATTAKDPHLEFLMYLGNDLSFYDIKDINDAYQCTASCNLDTAPNCENGGFLNYNCTCKCPEGLNGTTCGQTTSTACGGVISLLNGNSTEINTPNYPTEYTSGTECVWLIKAEDNSRIKITLDEMDLPYDTSTFVCQHYVQIDYNLAGQPGPRECGAISSPSPITYTTSLFKPRKNEMMIKFNSVQHSSISAQKGFKATIEAFESGCTSNPCQGGGTCLEGTVPGNYTCKCYPGMSGQNCEYVDASSHVSCGFESDTATGCFLLDDPTADMLWGTTTRQAYKVDSSTNYFYAKEGNIFANFELYKQVNYFYDTVIFKTFSEFEAAERCLVFSYFMEDKTVNYATTFQVYYVNSNGNETELLFADTDTSNSWIEKQYTIPQTDGLQLFFKGRYGANKFGFDDVHLYGGPCDHPCSQGNPCSNGGTCIAGSGNNFTCSCQEKFDGVYCERLKPTAEFTCDFEIDINSEAYDCILSNANNDDFDWTSQQGDTKSINTGPLLAYDGVKYVYIEASSPRLAEDRARLITDLVFQDSWYCLNLKYHMRGNNGMGTLSVGTTDGSGNDVVHWYKQGDQGPYWQSVDVNLQMFPGRQIFIEGIRGTSWQSDIGIDALSLSSKPCGEFVCDFDNDLKCGLFDCMDCDDDFNWSLNSGSTATIGSGPSGAKSGTYYLYAEMSGRSTNDTAKLVTKETFASTPYCFYFSYHMFGAKVGSLNIYINNTAENGTMTKVWSVSGNQGDQWYDEVLTFGTVNFYSQIVIEAVRANSYSGDIAIDAVEMTTVCPAFECTFENYDDACVLVDTENDDFDWTTGTGPTSTENTGPSHAAVGSGYKYIEASSPRVSGQTAVLKSTFLTVPSGESACLSFYYILNGSDVGSLTVEIDNLDGTITQLFSGNRETNIWRQEKMNIQSQQAFQINFKATVGSGELGDIAIDNVMLVNSRCAPVLNCTFETTGCLTNVDLVDVFDWTRRSGKTPSSSTGPTTAAQGSYYTYIETSYPRVNGDTAILKADLQTLGDFCLTFNYHMYGGNIGTLDVKAKESDQSPVTVLSLSGNKGDQWLQAAVNFTTTSFFELSFVGTRINGWQGDIAIDNVLVENGFCS